MATDVTVPALGESITEGTLAQWLKKPGEAVAQDEPIASLETDKVAVEVSAMVTFAVGWVCSATWNVSATPASVVTSPVPGVTATLIIF